MAGWTRPETGRQGPATLYADSRQLPGGLVDRWVGLQPVRVDRGRPVGHVDTLLLHDGAVLVTWLESDGSLWLRRISPEFSNTDPVALAGPGTAATKCVPRVALLHDFAGGKSAAQLL